VRRHSTMLASAAAAALASLAVTVAAPAIGDDGARDPGPDDFIACLRAHGLADVPADIAAVKPWLNERLERGDATTERAIDACAPHGKGGELGAVEKDLRECLVSHGAQIDGSDIAAVKRWVAEHADDPAARDAMKACHIDGPGRPPAGSCEGKAGPPPEPGDLKDAPAVTNETRAASLKIGT
jgi:hypothetical protein